MSASRAAKFAGPARRTWLLLSFARRELLNRYAGSATGLLWTFLHPLAQLAIYAFIFRHVFRATVPPEYAGASYVTFVAIALWPWIMFSEGLQRGMGAVAANAELIRKAAFPHELLVFAAILSTAVVHLVGFAVVLVVLKAFGEPLHLTQLPVALLVLVPYMLLATGAAAVLATLQTLMRDIEHVFQVVITIVFYASPILYSSKSVPEPYRAWVEANPLAWFCARLRDALLKGSGPVWGDVLATVAASAVLLAGVWFFRRLSPYFEDFL